MDPWGSPYEYINYADPGTKSLIRTDHFLKPMNGEYDLYSIGPDKKTKPSITHKDSYDDVIRADDGAFVGLAAGLRSNRTMRIETIPAQQSSPANSVAVRGVRPAADYCLALLSYRQVTSQLKEQSFTRLEQATKSVGLSTYDRLNLLETEMKMLTSLAADAGPGEPTAQVV